jgi:transcriptional regulator with XRE-family HTH domain
MSQLGDQIRQRRTELGLTQEELAKRTGITKGFVSDVETGKRNISAQTLLDLARVLGASLDALMKGETIQPSTGETGQVQIPSSLVELARRENLTFVQALTLLDMQRQIIAHRSLGDKPLDLDEVDWHKFYEKVRDFIS